MLISDSNRTVATLAITTLLKTGGESSIERLMKEIMTFMGEIGDEFKIVVVKAIHELCGRYPQKCVPGRCTCPPRKRHTVQPAACSCSCATRAPVGPGD